MGIVLGFFIGGIVGYCLSIILNSWSKQSEFEEGYIKGRQDEREFKSRR